MLIKVKVFPNSKKEEIVKKKEDGFEVFVREKARKGRANKRVFEILAGYFKLPISKIRLKKGAKKKNKIFELKEK